MPPPEKPRRPAPGLNTVGGISEKFEQWNLLKTVKEIASRRSNDVEMCLKHFKTFNCDIMDHIMQWVFKNIMNEVKDLIKSKAEDGGRLICTRRLVDNDKDAWVDDTFTSEQLQEIGSLLHKNELEFFLALSNHLNLLEHNAYFITRYDVYSFFCDPAWNIEETRFHFIQHVAKILANMLPGICCYDNKDGKEKELWGVTWKHMDPQDVNDIVFHYCYTFLKKSVDRCNTAAAITSHLD